MQNVGGDGVAFFLSLSPFLNLNTEGWGWHSGTAWYMLMPQ